MTRAIREGAERWGEFGETLIVLGRDDPTVRAHLTLARMGESEHSILRGLVLALAQEKKAYRVECERLLSVMPPRPIVLDRASLGWIPDGGNPDA